MARVEFKTFREASAFSKKLSQDISASSSIKKDGDIWWVDDPRIEHADCIQVSDNTEQPVRLQNPAAMQISGDEDEYNEYGYDRDGCYKQGYNKSGYDREGKPVYPF